MKDYLSECRGILNALLISGTVYALKRAQVKLHATQRNWDEKCLFECDDIMTEALKEYRLTAENESIQDIIALLAGEKRR